MDVLTHDCAKYVDLVILFTVLEIQITKFVVYNFFCFAFAAGDTFGDPTGYISMDKS